MSKDLGSVSLVSKASVQEPTVLGGIAREVQGSDTLMCNEPPYDSAPPNGNLLSLGKAAYHDLTNW
jgi:hypothetical protein